MNDKLTAPLLICFGTRPEWLKIKPLIDLLHRSQYALLFTGQHTDLLNDIVVDYRITISETDDRLNSIIGDCLRQFPVGNFGGILVQGDTASAFACAVAAFNRQLPIYYLEAGLRSFDLQHPYPEEGYRQMISRLATVNFCPTQLSATNLSEEKVVGKVYVVGNTVLDNLINITPKDYGNTVLITLHRRENHLLMDKWFMAIESLAQQYTHYHFILPLHPNPNVQKHRHLLKTVNVVNPLAHNEVIDVVSGCRLIITDSGGLQEEGAFFNRKVIVCREVTERPEGIFTGHIHLCPRPDGLIKIFSELESNPQISELCPYGDGFSAQRVKNIIW
jgi:UDP-N-acetylglucosamine 2-epimerase (non-hydrolysing)